MKNIYLLGALGSIGQQVLSVVDEYPNEFKVIGLGLSYDKGNNIKLIEKYRPQIVSLRDGELIDYQTVFPSTRFVYGDRGLEEVASFSEPGLFINALSGASGLIPTVGAIEAKKDILLANKETLVMAGEIVMNLVKKNQVKLIPIDSEHNALFQILEGKGQNVKKLIITASGGSFRTKKRLELVDVTVEEALSHPNWEMGPKITIDSATMVNKALEVIEAHHLFGVPYEKIETIIHYESIVHGMVSYFDGSTHAVLSAPDMRIPIRHAMFYPKLVVKGESLSLKKLSFDEMDYERYPLLKLGFWVGKQGGLLPTVFNAANEAAVDLFLNRKISFLEIERIIIREVETFSNVLNPTLEEIISTNQLIYSKVFNKNRMGEGK